MNVSPAMPVRLDNPRAWRTYLGGRMLDALHGKPNGEDGHFPEEWIMSVVAARNAGREHIPDEGMSRIPGTELTLKALLESDPAGYLGPEHAARHGPSPGVLVKLIDSAERLTLQVHPDREQARTLFGSPYGKTECWHILAGREDLAGERPCIYLGFQEYVTRALWEDLFARQDIPGMLRAMQRFEVSPGDTVLIEGGMPHAIGAGCLLMEIQEPTDYTIRVERTTPSGFAVADGLCHQGLGFQRMFDAFHYDPIPREEIRRRWFLRPRPVAETPAGCLRELVGPWATACFRLEEITARAAFTVPPAVGPGGLYMLAGSGTLTAGGQTLALEKTAQFFLPAPCGALTFTPDPGQELRVFRFGGPAPV